MNTALLTNIAAFLLPLLFPVAVALAAVLYMNLSQRLPMQQRLIVSAMAHTVVTAIEQMAPADAGGSQKKDQALHALVSILVGVGIKIPVPLLEMALEAAVFELHTLYPHRDDADPELTGPFPYRQTARSLPAVQLSVSPTAPTQPIPLPTEKRQS